jgi:hypothetical protein
MKKMIIAGLLTLAIAGYASAAATVTITGTVDATSWYVYAKDSIGDNQGLSLVGFKVTGVADAAPAAFKFSEYSCLANKTAAKGKTETGVFGWNQLQQAVDVSTQSDGTAFEIAVAMNPAQDTVSYYSGLRYDIRGMGQQSLAFDYVSNVTSSSAAGRVIGTADQGPDGLAMWDDNLGLLVAYGSLLEGVVPQFLGVFTINTWQGVANAEPATVVLENSTADRAFLPEPATLALLGIGGVMTLIRRRRR